MSNNQEVSQEMKDVVESQGQEAITVSPEILLAQIVTHVGEEFVILPTGGWMKIVDTITNFVPTENRSLLDELDELGVPVVPVSLAAKTKDEESSIIMPGGDKTSGGIIMP